MSDLFSRCSLLWDRCVPGEIAVGLMSGTSMDGIDAVVVEVQAGRKIKVLSSLCHPHTPGHLAELRAALSTQTIALSTLCELNHSLAECFAEAALAAISRANLPPGAAITVIGSHGQTLFHLPPDRNAKNAKNAKNAGNAAVRNGSTLQIGSPSVIGEIVGAPCVGDFRAADMVFGGTGAPLMPFADAFLYGDQAAAADLLLQNIGGIANYTLLRADGACQALDSGPGNMVLDSLCRALIDAPYDDNGGLASSGAVDRSLLEHLLGDEWFGITGPKATGHERFGVAYAEALIRLAGPDRQARDLLATAAELTAVTVVRAWRAACPGGCRVLVSGGGARNGHLMARLRDLAGPLFEVLAVDGIREGVTVDNKEAVGFAILGLANWHRVPANVTGATGASRQVICGVLHHVN